MTESGLKPGETCWRIERASCASVIVDGDDYFRHARQAMLRAAIFRIVSDRPVDLPAYEAALSACGRSAG